MVDTEVDSDNTLVDEQSPLLGAGAEAGQDGRPSLSSSGDNDGSTPRRRVDTCVGVEDFEGLPWYRRPSVFWLLGPYLLFTTAFGGSIVPKLNLILDLICRADFADETLSDPTFVFAPIVLGGDNPQCRVPKVQRSVAEFTLATGLITGVLSALIAPKMGSMSDRYGRTRLLVIASIGGVFNEIITILAAKYPDTFAYQWLILGSFFDGITGSVTAGGILTTSYVSDCTLPSKRSVAIGYLHACGFSGLAFGPLLAGYFVKWTGTLLSIFYVTLGCHVGFIIFVWFCTPESLSRKRQILAREKYQTEQDALAAQVRERVGGVVRSRALACLGDIFGSWLPALLSANPFAPLKILIPSGRHNAALRRNLVILAFIDSIVLAAAMGSGTVTILYVEYVFGWGNLESSQYVSFISFIRVFILLGLFPLINYYFHVRPLRRQRREGGLHLDHAAEETNNGADEVDLWILRTALLSDTVGILGYAFASTQQLFVLGGILASFGGLGGVVIQSTLTKHVPSERVGSLLGAVGLLHGLGRIFAPMVFNGIYAATVATYPQAFFFVLAVMFILCLVGALTVRPHLSLKEDE